MYNNTIWSKLLLEMPQGIPPSGGARLLVILDSPARGAVTNEVSD